MTRLAILSLVLLLAGCGKSEPDASGDDGARSTPAVGTATAEGTARADTPLPPVEIPDLPEDDPVAAARLLADPPVDRRYEVSGAERQAVDEALELLARRRPDAALARLPEGEAGSGRPALVRALVALGRDDPAAFAREGEAALRGGLDRAFARVAAGRALAMLGRLGEAETVLRDAGTDRALAPLALVLLARPDGDAEALEVSKRALAARPGDPAAIRARLVVLAALGRLDAAEDLLPRADRQDPTVLETEGAIRARRGDRAGAIESFSAALERDPGSVAAHRNLAGLLLAEGREEEGLRHLEAALAAAGRPGEVLGVPTGGGEPTLLSKGRGVARGYRSLALRHLARGDAEPERIRDFLERAVRADPEEPAGWRLLAAFLVRHGAPEEADRMFEEGVGAVRPEAVSALRLHLVANRLRRGDLEGARDVADRVPESDPARAWLDRLGEIPAEAEPPPDATIATRVARGADRYSVLLEALGGKPAETEDRIAFRAVLLERGYAPAFAAPPPEEDGPVLLETLVATDHGIRTRFYLVRGPVPGQAARFLDEPDPDVLSLLPDSLAAGLFYRAEGDDEGRAVAAALARLEAGEPEEAISALPADCTHPLAGYVAARARPTGSPIFDAVLAEHGDLPEVLLLDAEAKLVARKVPEALAAANRAAEGGLPPGVAVHVERIRALARFGPGDPDGGFEALEAIRKEHPEYLPVYEDLAGNYLLHGRFEEAMEVLEALGRHAPEVRTQEGYRTALARAEAGFLTLATEREDIERLVTAVDPLVRRRAAALAARLPYEDACDLVARFAGDADPEVRALAVRVLGDAGLRGATDAVRAAADDSDARVRGAVVRSLRLLLRQSGAREIVPFLSDPELYVREVAANELRTLAGREFGYDPEAPESEREEAVRRWEAWAKQR